MSGDFHAHPAIHGGPEKAVLLIALETIEELVSKGYPVYPGAMGENLTVRGLDFRQLRPGQRLRAGEAEIELTTIRRPCSGLDVYGAGLRKEIFDAAVKAGDPSSPRWSKSGFYARVLRPGVLRPGDIISLETTPA